MSDTTINSTSNSLTPRSATPVSFTHHPYSLTCSKKFIYWEPILSTQAAAADDAWCGNSSVASSLPPSPSTSLGAFPNVSFGCVSPAAKFSSSSFSSSIHAQALDRVVPFFQFPFSLEIPGEEAAAVDHSLPPKSALRRLFIGQLPFLFTDEQLNHAIGVATNGRATLVHIERIVNWKNNRAPTGCAHAYCRHEDAEAILGAHQRVLFDEEGVWVAMCPAEATSLQSYAATIRHQAPVINQPLAAPGGRASRGKMPTGLLSVEAAKSTYVRDEAFAVTSFVEVSNPAGMKRQFNATRRRAAESMPQDTMRPAHFSGAAYFH